MVNHAYSEAQNDVIYRFQKLSLDEQEQLLEEIEAIVRQRAKNTRRSGQSIKELSGLGKELWRGIDVEKYIEEERNSWRSE
jgi:hypothetical protein